MSDAPPLTASIRHIVGTLRIEVDFALTQSWTVLFGPSGAGKSTILRILAGLDQAHFAAIKLHAARPGRGRRPKVGLLLQEPALFPHLTVERNIAFGLHGLDRAAQSSRVERMLSVFDLELLRTRLPERLSGGEQQRVALARALAPSPAVLLLDEPFGALDGMLKAELLRALHDALVAEAIAALYVSHDIAEAFELGAEVLLLEAGKLVAQGPAVQVLAPHRARLLQQLGVAEMMGGNRSG